MFQKQEALSTGSGPAPACPSTALQPGELSVTWVHAPHGLPSHKDLCVWEGTVCRPRGQTAQA